MDAKTQKLAALLAIATCLLFGTLIARHSQSTKHRFALSVSLDESQRIDIKSTQDQVVLEKINGHWVNNRQPEMSLDSGVIAGYLFDLTHVPVRRQLQLSPTEITETGLTSPQASISITQKSGTVTLKIANNAPSIGLRYAQESHSDEVLLIPQDQAKDLIQSIDYFRPKHLLRTRWNATEKIEIQNGDQASLVLIPSVLGWEIVGSPSAIANPEKLNRLFNEMNTATATRYDVPTSTKTPLRVRAYRQKSDQVPQKNLIVHPTSKTTFQLETSNKKSTEFKSQVASRLQDFLDHPESQTPLLLSLTQFHHIQLISNQIQITYSKSSSMWQNDESGEDNTGYLLLLVTALAHIHGEFISLSNLPVADPTFMLQFKGATKRSDISLVIFPKSKNVYFKINANLAFRASESPELLAQIKSGFDTQATSPYSLTTK